jgi:hypothetical protein
MLSSCRDSRIRGKKRHEKTAEEAREKAAQGDLEWLEVRTPCKTSRPWTRSGGCGTAGIYGRMLTFLIK